MNMLVREQKRLTPLLPLIFLLFMIWILNASFRDDEDEGSTVEFIEHGSSFPHPELVLRDEEEEEEATIVVPIHTKQSPDFVLVKDFFTKHNPSKIATINELLKKYTLDELNTKLENKYGVGLRPPKQTITPPPPPPRPIIPPLQLKLEAFLKRHDPARASTLVDSLFPQYKWDEAGLERYLRKKYSTTMGEYALVLRLEAFFHQYDRREEHTAQKLVQKHKTETKLEQYLFKKYKRSLPLAEPIKPATTMPVIVPEQVTLESKIVALLIKFHPGISFPAVWAKRLMEMYGEGFVLEAKLEQDYGVDLSSQQPKPVAPVVLYKRLEAFFQQHNPEKLETITAAVEKYHVDLPALNSILRSKYRVDLNKSPSPGLDLMRVKEGTCDTVVDDHFEDLTASQATTSTVVGFVPSHSIKFLCFGLPGTGMHVIQDLFRKELDMTFVSEEELKPLLSLKQQQFEKVALLQQQAIISPLASYYYQELIAIFPQARILILTRDFESWAEEHKLDTKDELTQLVFGSAPYSKRLLRFAYEDYYDQLFAMVPQRIIINVFSEAHLSRVLADTFFITNSAAIAKQYALSMSWEMQTRMRDASKPNLLATIHRSTTPRVSNNNNHKQFVVLDLLSDASNNWFTLGLDWKSRLQTWQDWRATLDQSRLPPGAAAAKQLVLGTQEEATLQFPQEDYVAGPLINVLVREFAIQQAETRFVLVLQPNAARDWPKQFRCFVQRTFRGQTADWELAVFTRLFGFAPNDVASISDHLLLRRYQDFVDRVHVLLPSSRLFVLDPAQQINWSEFCHFMQELDVKRCTQSMIQAAVAATTRQQQQQIGVNCNS